MVLLGPRLSPGFGVGCCCSSDRLVFPAKNACRNPGGIAETALTCCGAPEPVRGRCEEPCPSPADVALPGWRVAAKLEGGPIGSCH